MVAFRLSIAWRLRAAFAVIVAALVAIGITSLAGFGSSIRIGEPNQKLGASSILDDLAQ